MLSAAVTVSFHYCGMGEIGLAIRGDGEYVGWVGNKVRTESCNLDAVKHGKKNKIKKCGCAMSH